MSKDISTEYTKEKNEKCGRKGYCGFKREKVTVISPKEYGMFLQKRRHWVNIVDEIRILTLEKDTCDKYGFK